MKRARPLDEFPEAMTVPEAAAALGIGTGAAYRAVAAGTIPALRIGPGRIIVPREALRRFLAEATAQRRIPREKPRLLRLSEARRWVK